MQIIPTIKKRAVSGFVIGLIFSIFLVILLMISASPAKADETFDAYETVREAGIGTNDTQCHYDCQNDADDRYEAPAAPKSEHLYLNNGKTVCFKLESDVSVAYYCN